MTERYTGYINATCPLCKEVVRHESVPGANLDIVRDLLKQIADAYQRWFPFANVRVFDPRANNKTARWR